MNAEINKIEKYNNPLFFNKHYHPDNKTIINNNGTLSVPIAVKPPDYELGGSAGIIKPWGYGFNMNADGRLTLSGAGCVPTSNNAICTDLGLDLPAYGTQVTMPIDGYLRVVFEANDKTKLSYFGLYPVNWYSGEGNTDMGRIAVIVPEWKYPMEVSIPVFRNRDVWYYFSNVKTPLIVNQIRPFIV